MCDRADSVVYRISKTALDMCTKTLVIRLLVKQFVTSVHLVGYRQLLLKVTYMLDLNQKNRL
jgi:hypothetical protein